MAIADPSAAKAALRLALRTQRKSLAAAAPDAGERAAERLPQGRLGGWAVVAGYRPMRDEIDPVPLMDRFAAAGARLALPVALAPDQPLAFRAWTPGDPLAADACGVPSPTADAPDLRPDLVIAPLLAFDRSGGRMGQGGGHYDRTLAALKASGPLFVLGLGYAGQEVARIPREGHDQGLDAILTEKAYIEVE
jgi:5-formyltetrahydrofolate cyclo-ligase